MPGDELPGLNGGQLAELGLGVTAKNLKEGIERSRRAVVVLVEGRGGRLDTLRVGWKTSVNSRWQHEAGGGAYAAAGPRATAQIAAHPWLCFYTVTRYKQATIRSVKRQGQKQKFWRSKKVKAAQLFFEVGKACARVQEKRASGIWTQPIRVIPCRRDIATAMVQQRNDRDGEDCPKEGVCGLRKRRRLRSMRPGHCRQPSASSLPRNCSARHDASSRLHTSYAYIFR